MFRVTARVGPRVVKHASESLEDALAWVQTEATKMAGGEAHRAPVRRGKRNYEPVQQVGARLEVRGPQRFFADVTGGIDVRGDGSIEAWTGGARRQVVEQRDGETPFDALRRRLSEMQG